MISPNNTLFIGNVLQKLDTVASTNQYALEILTKSKPSEGTVILAYDQYAGRGQVNKHWESEPGKNLTLSIILYPTFLPAQQHFLLNQAISLGVLETLQTFIGEGVRIKWPNDLYVQDKKITGILIQNSLRGRVLQSSVIGIGLNVNQAIFKSDAPNPTSIFLETKQEVALERVLQELCRRIEHRYLQLKAGRPKKLQDDYRRALYRLEEAHLFRRPTNEVVTGIIKGVTARGMLIVATDKGEEIFAMKEIAYLI